MEKGDILKGAKRGRDAAFHFIVFLDGNDSESFVGAVLTHSESKKYGDNTLMLVEHFKKTSEENKPFAFQFDDTHLVKGRFIKLQNWGPFEKIGELTQEGIKFVESETGALGPMLWDEYAKTNKIYEK